MGKRNRDKLLEQSMYDLLVKINAGMLAGRIRPTKKPDCDNIAKAILDALNGIAYHDDSQVVTIAVEKWYTPDEPCVIVTIKEV